MALDDNLVRIFAGERMAAMMQRLGMDEDEAIESKMVSKQIEGAQKKVEAHNFDMRKNLLEYDNVANEQRKVIYTQRSEIMDAENISDMIANMRQSVIDSVVNRYLPPEQVRQAWDIRGLEAALLGDFSLKVDIDGEWLAQNPALSAQDIKNRLNDILIAIHQEKQGMVGAEIMQRVEKYVALQVIDQQWKQHLQTMDMLRQAIWLRSRAQKDPKREYQREAFEIFSDLLDQIQFEIVRLLTHLRFEAAPTDDSLEQSARENREQQLAQANYSGGDEAAAESATAAAELDEALARGVARNDPCPCGSGKKYKQCHGKIA